jgi:hypothetical protein
MSTTTTTNKLTTRQDIELSNEIFKEYRSSSYGTDNYTKISPFAPNLLATDGVIHMAEELQCYWLLDIVASYMTAIQRLSNKTENYFFVIRLSKLEGNKALFTIDEGNDDEIFNIIQEIPYTDLKMNVRMYLQTDGKYWTLMQPSEY